ncbi:MAG: nucleotidyltransferase family protein [Ignavibacteriae bacterium]|nr:nucleotidyltransferase family protein [Ignavibacteriota bacterium]
MKKDIQYILSILKNVEPIIKEKFNVNKIEVFGSYIRNKQNQKSDVDILVTFLKTPSLLKFIELENYLSDELEIKVDLVMKNSLKPRLRHSILNNSIPI